MATLRNILCALAALSLGSCSVADKFSGRAVDYNIQAEQAQQQALLMNIVRASLGRPMQFTTLSTITGTASISGGGGLLAPFGRHRPPLAATPDQLTLTGTVSGGPTFTVPVLDTQEFYQGELKPLTGQEYRFFLDEGISPAVLFYLFVEHIELTVAGTTTPPQTFEYHNYVNDDFDLARFEAVADYLLSMGLGIENVHRNQSIGPELTSAQLHNLRDIAEATNAGLHLTPVRPGGAAAATDDATPSKPAKKRPAAKAASRYQLEKNMVVYRPCLQPPPGQSTGIDPSLICGSKSITDTPEQEAGNLSRSGGFTAPTLSARLAQVQADYVAQLRQSGNTAKAAEIAALLVPPATAKLQLRIYMRSTEAILHHLGSIAARYLFTDGANRRVIQVKVGEPYLPYPTTPCPRTSDPMASPEVAPGYSCESLFVLTDDASVADSPLSVDYDNKTFSVLPDNKGGGRTMRLLDLVKQLLALHTSAKELPASNVLNIIGGGAQ